MAKKRFFRCEHCGKEGELHGDVIEVKRQDGTSYHVCINDTKCWRPEQRAEKQDKARKNVSTIAA